MKFDWLLLFHIHFQRLKKGCDLEGKMVRFVNKSALLKTNQIARITSDFKMGVIKALTTNMINSSFQTMHLELYSQLKVCTEGR